MALKSKRPCAKSGCPALVDTGYCDAHQHLKQERDLWRGSAAESGYDHEWRKVRVLALKRDFYLCQLCLLVGRTTVALDVDHIIPLTQGGERLNLSNLQSVCRPCHRTKTERDTNR